MSGNFEHMDALIAKVLAGEASPEEARELESWRNSSAEQEEYFALSKKLFEAMASDVADFTVNTNAAWNKLHQRISEPETKVIPLFKRIKPLRIAASVALLIVFGLVINTLVNTQATEPLMVASTTKTVKQKLPDGSTVFLNKHSEITYVKNKDNTREVKLKGEAFFDVVHNEKEPFIITVEDVIIKDIGTSFNVKAIPGTQVVEVSVESGEVQFSTKNNPGMILVKGESATYNKLSGEFAKHISVPAENAGSYHNRMFIFKDTPLKEVIRQLNAVYDSNIQLANESLGNRALSVKFADEQPDVIVSIICETLDLEAEETGSGIVLKESANKNE